MKALPALNELLSGNQRYQTGTSTMSNPVDARTELLRGQSPIACILRCADSRVAPEIVFDQPLGKLFVCGVAGNVPTIEIIESMEYAVGVLGVSLIVVMGHSNCGAVHAALHNEHVDGVFALIALSPVPDMDECVAHNAEQGVSTILNNSLYLASAVQQGTLQIVAGVQDIASGEFELVAQTKLE
mgnify:FL=1